MRRMRRALVLLLSAILIITACLPTAMTGLALENPDAETTAPVETDPAETTASADTEPGETDAAEPTDVPATEPGAPEGTEPAEPSGTEPTDGTIVDATEPAVTDPTATDPAQAETTEPGAADPTETAPQETEPAATEPVSGDTVYTIHFDLGGGSFAARKAAARSAAAAKQNTTSDGGSVTAAVGEDITLPEAPEKAERSFAGWLSARTGAVYGAGDSYVVAADDTLTAQWNMLQRLGVDAEPEDGSALKDAQQVTAAVSEAQQAGVESAVGSALGGDTVKTLDVLAADISFVGASGEELQPAEGESVPVTLTVPESYIDDDADFLVVYHMVQQADGSYFAEPVQYAACAGDSQELSFGATGFSIYAVASVGKRDTDTGSTLVKGTGSGNVTYEIQEEQSQVFFFKEDHIYKVYGSLPSNFEIMGSATLGVADGSGRSLAIAGETLFYLSRAGIMVYSGGIPQPIGSAFGMDRFKNAVGGSDGLKYYVSMTGPDGELLYVYDTQKGLWHTEDATKARYFARFGGNLFLLNDQGEVWIAGNVQNAPESTEEEPVAWSAEFGDFTENDPNKKGVSKLQLRMELEEGAEVQAYLKFDGGEWLKVDEKLCEAKKRSYYLPIVPRRGDHYRLKLEGKGTFRLYSLTREYYSGSE